MVGWVQVDVKDHLSPVDTESAAVLGNDNDMIRCFLKLPRMHVGEICKFAHVISV